MTCHVSILKYGCHFTLSGEHRNIMDCMRFIDQSRYSSHSRDAQPTLHYITWHMVHGERCPTRARSASRSCRTAGARGCAYGSNISGASVRRGELDSSFVITHNEPPEAGPQMNRLIANCTNPVRDDGGGRGRRDAGATRHGVTGYARASNAYLPCGGMNPAPARHRRPIIPPRFEGRSSQSALTAFDS